MKKSKNQVWLIALILVVVLALGGFFVWRHYDNSSQGGSVNRLNMMNDKQMAGLAIVYAHAKYPKNTAWNEVYEEALNGDLQVDAGKKYAFAGYTVSAKGNRNVYVINQEVVFTANNWQQKGKATLVLGDAQKQLCEIKVVDAYNYIRDHEGIGDWRAIGGKLKVPVAQNNAASSNSGNSQSIPDLNNRQLAILAGFTYDKGWTKIMVKDQAKDDTFGPDYGKTKNESYFLTSHGDPTSRLTFKRVGNTIVVKHLDTSLLKDHNMSIADLPMKTYKYNILDLVQKYYSTSEQKQVVDDLASQLISDSDSDD